MKQKMAFPIATLTLVALNVAIFVHLQSAGPLRDVIYEYGMRPAAILRGEHLETLLTSMFMHGGWIHLIGNMLGLLVFGVILERRIGPPRFLIIYFVSDFAASGFDLAIHSSSWIPSIGASAAIMGVTGACFAGYPTARGPLAFFIFLLSPIFLSFMGWFVALIVFF